MRTVKNLLQAALILLLSALLLCNLYLIGARTLLGQENPTVFGFSWAVVLTGSMEPTISGNDLVITQAKGEYHVDDIIMFESGSSLVTHRIVEEREGAFITQGDANNARDSKPVQVEAIVGKVVATIPQLGVALSYLRSPLGMMCLVFLAILMIEIPYLYNRTQQMKEGTNHDRS